MDKNIKKILGVSLIVFFITIVFSQAHAVTIKETTNDSDKYDTIEKGSYIIGSTKFTPETIITGAVAAQAGANDMKLYIAKNGTAEGYEYPKVYYYNTFGKWKEYTPEGKLVDAKLSNTDFDIYFVDNKEKTGNDSATNKQIELPMIEKNEYAYTFMSDSNVVKVGTALENEEIVVPEAPEKEHYTFKGWRYVNDNNELGSKVEVGEKIKIEKDTVLAADWKLNKYTVRFLTEDGKDVLFSHEFEYGADLQYELLTNLWDESLEIEIPEKKGTDDYEYCFAGWDKEFGIIEKDTDFFAVYEKLYLVEFCDDDGEVLNSNYLSLGETPYYYAYNLEKDTAQYHYEFAGWDNEITPVNGKTVYTATYNKTVKKYLISFYDYEGTLLANDMVDYGTEIFYNGVEPTRPEDDFYAYEFTGWRPSIENVTVTEEASFTARYNAIAKYKYTFMSDSAIVETGTALEGEEIVAPAVPEKEHYTFEGWYYIEDNFEFENKIDVGEKIKLSRDATIVAKWSLNDDTFIMNLKAPSLYNESELVWIENEEGPYIPIFIDGKYCYELGINIDSYRVGDPQDEKYSVTGYVIYEKTENEYKEIAKVTDGQVVYDVEIEPGEKKEYIARVFVIDSNGIEHYSDFSNIVTIDHTVIEAPRLVNVTLGEWEGNEEGPFIPYFNDGKYSYCLAINKGIYKEIEGNTERYSVTGYAIYEKTQTGGYKDIIKEPMNGLEEVEIKVEPGEKKEYVARVYATDSEGGEHYSDDSNVITIDHTVIEAPTLYNASKMIWEAVEEEPYEFELYNGKYGADIGIDKEPYRVIRYEDARYCISGYVIYEKTQTGYSEIIKEAIDGAETIVVEFKPGEKKEYVARVYATDSKGEEHYSDYSDVLVLDGTNIPTPTLSAPLGDDDWCELNVITMGIYGHVENMEIIDGTEIYEKVNDEYILVETTKYGGIFHFNSGEKKDYVARIYVINSKNEKIYSDYSNICTVND